MAVLVGLSPSNASRHHGTIGAGAGEDLLQRIRPKVIWPGLEIVGCRESDRVIGLGERRSPNAATITASFPLVRTGPLNASAST
jgi:hypothetical protein